MPLLLSITKLQNLKAIHNGFRHCEYRRKVVINHKTTKFESNSQQHTPKPYRSIRCYQSQNYKIWKQFTTEEIEVLWELMLLSITKLQNLKAIHNTFPFVTLMVSVVINHKTTKFESNSQRICASQLSCSGCYQSQNYKIWKQFTTSYSAC